jgi:transmembrane 9 superfamily member 2/4
MPGMMYIVWFIADIILWSLGSSAGPSVGVMFTLLGMWIGIMFPLTILGSYLANKQVMGEYPVSTNQIPRLCPAIVWYMNPIILTLISGILPFGAIFNEIFLMLSAMWSHHFFSLFGVSLIVFILLIIITQGVAVVLCYFQLFNEDYHWWWRPFYIAGVTVSCILEISFENEYCLIIFLTLMRYSYLFFILLHHYPAIERLSCNSTSLLVLHVDYGFCYLCHIGECRILCLLEVCQQNI